MNSVVDPAWMVLVAFVVIVLSVLFLLQALRSGPGNAARMGSQEERLILLKEPVLRETNNEYLKGLKQLERQLPMPAEDLDNEHNRCLEGALNVAKTACKKRLWQKFQENTVNLHKLNSEREDMNAGKDRIRREVIQKYQKKIQKVVVQLPLSDEELAQQHARCHSSAMELKQILQEYSNIDMDAQDEHKLAQAFTDSFSELQQRNKKAKDDAQRTMVADVVDVYQMAVRQVVSQMPLSDEELTRQHRICQANAMEAWKKLLEQANLDTYVEDDKMARFFQEEFANLRLKNHEYKHQQDLGHFILKDIISEYRKELQQVVGRMPLLENELIEQHNLCQSNVMEFKGNLLLYTPGDIDVEDDKLAAMFEEGMAELQMKNHEAKSKQDEARTALLTSVFNWYKNTLKQVVGQMPLSEDNLMEQHGICRENVLEFKKNLLTYTTLETDVDDGKLERMFADGTAELKMKNLEAKSKHDETRAAILADVIDGYQNGLKQICSQMPLTDIALSKQHGLCQMYAVETMDKVQHYTQIDINVKDYKMEKAFADGWAELMQKNSEAKLQKNNILKGLKAEYNKGLEQITSEMPLSLAYLTVRHDKSKSSAMEHAVNLGYATAGVGLEDPDIVKIFVDGWADVQIKNLKSRIAAAGYPYKEATTRDEEAFIEACRFGSLNEVRRVVESGVNLDVRGTGWIGVTEVTGWTGLMWASIRGHVDIVLYLIQNGADVNNTDSWGQSALWRACYNGHLEIVKLLVENGADVTKASNNGQTPLMAARQRNQQHIMDHLTRLGAT